MAFTSSYEIEDTCATLTYFKIIDMNVNPIQNTTHVRLGGFIDDSAQSPVSAWDFTFDGQLSLADAETAITTARPEFGDGA